MNSVGRLAALMGAMTRYFTPGTLREVSRPRRFFGPNRKRLPCYLSPVGPDSGSVVLNFSKASWRTANNICQIVWSLAMSPLSTRCREHPAKQLRRMPFLNTDGCVLSYFASQKCVLSSENDDLASLTSGSETQRVACGRSFRCCSMAIRLERGTGWAPCGKEAFFAFLLSVLTLLQ